MTPQDIRWLLERLTSMWATHRTTAGNIKIQITNAIPNGWEASCLHNGHGEHVIKMKPGRSTPEYLAIAAHETAHAVLHDMEITGKYRKLDRNLEELTVQMIAFVSLSQFRNCPDESSIFMAAIESAKHVLIHEYINRFGGIAEAVLRFPIIRLAFTKGLPPYLADAMTIIDRYPMDYSPRASMPTTISIQQRWQSG